MQLKDAYGNASGRIEGDRMFDNYGNWMYEICNDRIFDTSGELAL
jgi:hypothetical protein